MLNKIEQLDYIILYPKSHYHGHDKVTRVLAPTGDDPEQPQILPGASLCKNTCAMTS